MRRVWAAMIVASLGWGTAGVAARAALNEGVTPYRLALYRSTLAVVAILVYLAVTRRGLPTSAIAWKVGIIMGLSNLAMPFIFSNIALQYASAGFLGLMTALIPIITAAVAHLALPDERMSIVKTVGLLVGFGGVAVLLLSGDSGLAEGGRPLLAGILGLAAVTSISVGSIYAKHHAGAYSLIDVTGIQFGSGAILIAAATAFAEGGPTAETATAWALLAYMALASTVLPMLLYYWMLRKISATYAALAGYVVPVIAVTAGVVLLDEQLQSGILVGGLLILVGVLITDRAERRPPVRAVTND